MRDKLWYVVVLSVACGWGTKGGLVTAADPLFVEQTLCQRGDQGYHTYRIPSLLMTGKGTILFVCEARKNNGSDHGDIDLVLRRSENGGQTWSPQNVIADDGEHTMGNPCLLQDRSSGVIWLSFSRDNKQVLLMRSSDDGRSWSKPRDITREVLPAQWHWVGPGPGHGIQLQKGRLVMPCWAGVEANVPFGATQLSYVFFSDDGGQTWHAGAAAGVERSDECEVVQRVDGSLYMTARSRHQKKRRAYAVSQDGGHSWLPAQYDDRLPEPSCQGSILRLSQQGSGQKNRVVLAHPSNPGSRTQMTVRLSYDECRSWPVAKVVYAGSSAYSDLGRNQAGEILLAFEKDGYAQISLIRVNLEWLTDGGDQVEPIDGNR